MLAELAVRDLGVIEDLSLVLGPGMTALTGETGAGKTMVVGAIELLAGGRADPGVVRPGAEEATVEGRFVDGDDEVVLTRVVAREGRSRAYRDGRLVTAAALADEAAARVDLHGQHTHVALLTAASQRRALDRFAGIDLAPLRTARDAISTAEGELAALGGDASSRARDLELLRFQLADIDGAAIAGPDEDDALRAEEGLLADADGHRQAAAASLAALGTEGGARDLIGTALAALGERGPFAAHASRLAAVAAELDDVARDLREAGDAIEADPARLDEVQARRRHLSDLRRRYTSAGADLADLLAARDELERRAAELESHGARAQAAEQALRDARAAFAREAAAVAAARRSAAGPLASAVEGRLRGLALAGAAVRVEVRGDDPADEVVFMLAANAGLPPAPLAKAASGGELARAMLAVRLVVGASAPTLVFDEVDAGVGGAAARSVGLALAALAGDKQVLVVTHLPQVAAFADAQIGLVKETRRGSTSVRAAALDGAQRVAELSRMLSGLPGSDTGQEHAEELLVTAARERGR
jgi:DNA repair protein RecN (Recombination protein N)